MEKIAVFVNEESELCDFFNANRFLIFEKVSASWNAIGEFAFDKVVPTSPAETRAITSSLLALIEGCTCLAGGSLVGIPYSVFDRAGLHIFEISEINDDIFDGMIDDIKNANLEQDERIKTIEDAYPVETSTPGIFVLDLITLQQKFPEVSSKKAMMSFLENTPFLELRLSCKHIPPWIENSGKYEISLLSEEDGIVNATITRRC